MHLSLSLGVSVLYVGLISSVTNFKSKQKVTTVMWTTTSGYKGSYSKVVDRD
jgi:hypothetical protein